MASDLVRKLIDSGIHFGHRTSRWNPKMGPYIFGKQDLIHVVDIRETVKGILRSRKFLGRVVAEGKDVLFVGTKRQARGAIKRAAEGCQMHYVTERWLGGTLTNFRTIRSRLARLEELEAIEGEGMSDKFSKKMISMLARERRKIYRNLNGIRRMGKLPGALVLVDVRREHIAAREAHKLKIPVIGLIDTDSDPDMVDIPIPGNDDAMRGIDLVLAQLADAISGALRARPITDKDSEDRPARRSSRVMARADESGPAPEGEATESPDSTVASRT